MVTWSGSQDAQGYELKDFRNEQLAAKPVYTSPDDEGRLIFVTTPGADYGPWEGDDVTGDWVRPASWGGGGYTEPGLLLYSDPRPLQDFGIGFAPFVPAYIYTSRALLPTDILFLQILCDNFGSPDLVGAGNLGPGVPIGSLGELQYHVWWDAGLGLIFFGSSANYAVNLIAIDTVSGDTLDVITIDIEAPPP